MDELRAAMASEHENVAEVKKADNAVGDMPSVEGEATTALAC
jgi:hypothetical protein